MEKNVCLIWLSHKTASDLVPERNMFKFKMTWQTEKRGWYKRTFKPGVIAFKKVRNSHFLGIILMS